MFPFGWASARYREARAVRRALVTVSEGKIPVRVEVEGSGIRFMSVVSMRRDLLVLLKPRSLRARVRKDAIARLTLRSEDRLQVRAPIRVPDIRLPLGARQAMLCEIPMEFSGQCRRAGDRFDTSRYRSLNLHLPVVSHVFPVLDLSSSGACIHANRTGRWNVLAIGSQLAPARLLVGQKLRIELASVIPRNRHNGSVGMDLAVQADRFSGRYFTHLLRRFEQQELMRLRAELY